MKPENLEDIYELSPLQQGMLFHTVQESKPGTYSVQFVAAFENPFHPECFRSAWEDVVHRQAALRSTFHWDGLEKPYQVVQREVKLPWRELDWRDPIDKQSERVARFLADDQLQGFDLADAPPMRFTLIRCAIDHWQFVWTFHHIILDAWSLSIVLNEVVASYEALLRGEQPQLEPAPHYRDFIAWLGQQSASQAEAFWRGALAGFTASTPLRIRRSQAEDTDASFAREKSSLPVDSTAALQAFARANQLTVNTVVQAAWAVLLSRYSGEEDIVWGTSVSGRPAALESVEATCGLFINTLPMRARVPSDALALPWMKELQAQQADVRQFEYSHLIQIQGWSQVPRPLPLFESLLIFENHGVEASLSRASTLRIREAHLTQRPTHPLNIVAIPGPALEFDVWYDGAKFDQPMMVRLLGHLCTIINSLIRSPMASIAEIEWLMPDEVPATWNATCTALPRQCSVHQIFEEVAVSTPEAIAIEHGSVRISYDELNDRANRLANYLMKKGARKGALISVCLEQSIEMVVAILAIVKCGAAYVPIASDYPHERINFMLADSGCNIRIDQSFLAGIDLTAESAQNPDASATPDDLIYVMYTSGSTGQPKGTCIPHRAVVRLVRNTNYIELTPGDRVAQASNPGFDAATFEIWGALLNGAALVLLPREIMLAAADFGRELEHRQITVLFLTTALFNQFARQAPLAFRSLRVLLFGGEAVDANAVRTILRHDSPEHLLHVYGPTETTTFATFHEVVDVAAAIPIGLPISNTEVFVLDGRRRPVPIGVPGEIYIAGDGLASGYHNRPDLTAEKFVTLPGGCRAYRTGDFGRRSEDGAIEFVGRTDNQVKLRGFRIELGEIEAALRDVPGVTDAIAIVREDQPGDRRLVAYLRGDSICGDAEIRDVLRRNLPPYMIPAAFAHVDSFPLTPNGKLDRGALPAPTPDAVSAPLAHTPSTELEQSIAVIWREVLGAPQVGLDDNFFDLGGHSLLIMRVYSQLKKLVERPFSIVDLFAYSTVRSLARFLSKASDEKSESAEVLDGPAAKEPIAIIAMAGRFPGAANVDEFWRNLRAGVESIARFSNEEMLAAGVDKAALRDPLYVNAGTVLEGAEMFDAQFFGFNAREAEITDPQHRVFLECAHEALESAGYDPHTYFGSIGVFAGSTMSTYLLNNLQQNHDAIRDVGALQLLIGNDKDFLASRASYKLNLRGPSLTVQTACSTSLVAVHMACRSLLENTCEMALAGGVSILYPQKTGYRYQEDGILSPDGHCRAFDAEGRGTIAGTGVAIIALKRLSKAIADGDTICALVLGSAINNDGSQKIGYTAPSLDGQSKVVEAALRDAGVAAADITYIETHGTGTALGDPIEVAALTRAFRASTQKSGYCGIGSLKTNCGHLDAAAGVAGMIKTVLQLKHRQIAPSLNYRNPNSNIEFATSPFFVNSEVRDWQGGGAPLRAGVSSFGIGGTNAHVILQEAPEQPPSGACREWQTVAISAKTTGALDESASQLADWFDSHPSANLADVAYTLQVGRRSYKHRRAFCAKDVESAIRGLRGTDWNAAGEVPAEPQQVVFLFPGQGAQYLGMGRGLYDAQRVFRETFDHCSELLRPGLDGRDLRQLVFGTPGESAAESSARLQETWLTQPALFCIEYALAQLWMHWGVQPAAMIGHSIGEYVAACISGVMSLEDSIRLVALRGALMNLVPRGAMLAVPLTEDEAAGLAGSRAEVAAVNGPRACVISGTDSAISEIDRELRSSGIEGWRLHTSHAFHSTMMDAIVPQFAEAVRNVSLRAPRVPYISNVTGTWIDKDAATDPAYWAKHLRETVRFAAGVNALLAESVPLFLEMGPGEALSTFVRKSSANSSRHSVTISSLPPHHGTATAEEQCMRAAAQLWTNGVALDWRLFHEEEKRRRIPLPTYPFQRKRYFIEPAKREQPAVEAMRRSKDPADWFYTPSWQRGGSVSLECPAPGTTWLLVGAGGFNRALASFLRNSACRVVVAEPGLAFARVDEDRFTIRIQSKDDYVRLCGEVCRANPTISHVVHTAGVSDSASSDVDETFFSLLYLAQALPLAEANPIDFTVVTNHAHEVVGTEIVDPAKAALTAAFGVVPHEYSFVRGRAIDIEWPSAAGRIEELCARVIAETASADPAPVLAIRGSHRWIQDFRPIRLIDSGQRTKLIRDGGVYLITGGFGGMGLEIAKDLAATARVKLILVGRSGASRERQRAAIAEIEALGGEVMSAHADVADAVSMRAVLDLAKSRFQSISGVIHAAGVAGGGLIEHQTEATVRAVFTPKVYGTRLLYDLLRDSDLDFFVVFSSQRSVLPAPGRIEYCAANAYLDGFAAAHAGSSRWPVISIAWDAWRDSGMGSTGEEVLHVGPFADAKRLALTNAEGVAVFRRALDRALPVVIVSTRDFNDVIRDNARLTTAAIAEAYQEAKAERLPHSRPELDSRYEAPRDAVEEALCGVWQQLLGIDRIGVKDNFFELGGDSVISIQMINRVAALGLRLTAKDVFRHQTVAELARAATHTRQDQVRPRGIAAGSAGSASLTPVQSWFFEHEFADRHHFNQAVMLTERNPGSSAFYDDAFAALGRHHDALQLRFRRCNDEWTAVYATDDDPLPFYTIDLTPTTDEELTSAIEAHAAAVQRGFNLAEGPIFRAVRFACGNERPARLLIAVHHLAMDFVSWRILLEDLETVCNALAAGYEITLPAKTTSYKEWAERLQNFSRNGGFIDELPYWVRQSSAAENPLPLDFESDGRAPTAALSSSVRAELDPEYTDALLHSVPRVYKTQINVVLLTVLARTFYEWTGAEQTVVDMEGLGREPLFDDIDVSRTIGWFTSIYPVAVEWKASDDSASALSRMRDYLRAIPSGGIGYGALRFLSGDNGQALATASAVRICFLYLGQTGIASSPESRFDVAAESVGPLQSLVAPLMHDLTVKAAISGGGLSFEWLYNRSLFQSDTIERLATRYIAILRETIDHCLSRGREPARSGHHLTQSPSAAVLRDRFPGACVVGAYPLTPMQEGMLFHTLSAPQSAEYFRQVSCTLEGNFNVVAFRAAWQAAIDRHPILRTAFLWEDVPEPLQVVLSNAKLDWTEEASWVQLSADEQDARLATFLVSDRARGFRLDSPPAMRCSVIRLSTSRYEFVWSFHHILLDGWSASAIVQEVFREYTAIAAGGNAGIEPPPPFSEYLSWIARQPLGEAELFWRQYLHGFRSATALPEVSGRNESGAEEPYSEFRLRFNPGTGALLRAFARDQRITLNTLMLGTWSLLLSRYSGEKDVMFGAVVAGRPPEIPDVERMIGVFINTLPVRVNTDTTENFGGWLAKVQERNSECRHYQHAPLARIRDWSGIPRPEPMFDSLIIFENYPVSSEVASWGGLRVGNVQSYERTNYPLTLTFPGDGSEWVLFTYDTSRFDETAIERIAHHFENVIKGVLENPLVRTGDLKLLTAAEREQFVEWNATKTAYSDCSCVHELIEAQAARTPQRPAVRYGDKQLTYRELSDLSTRLANYLRRHGAGPDRRVGVCLERSLEMVVAALGVLKSGAAYVPLDPDLPAERLAFMLEDSGAELLVTQSPLAGDFAGFGGRLVEIDGAAAAIASEGRKMEPNGATPDNLAYVIYTSGSTGKPKGVMVRHGGVVNLLESMRREPGLGSQDVLLAVTTLSFDIAGLELYLPLIAGARVVIASREVAMDGARLAAELERSGATVMQATPATWRMLIDAGWQGDGSLKVLCGGEAMSRDMADALLGRAGSVWNLYGPTETTIWSLARRVEHGNDPVTIGRPIANTGVYILDSHDDLAPIGVAGELCIAGEGLSRGYLNRNELTAEKFVESPFGKRIYRTGDLARWNASGEVEFLGRIDHQVKVRGYRIELGEIEFVLRQHAGVREAVVMAREDVPGDTRLVAYIVPSNGGAPSLAELRKHAGAQLPDYMLPAAALYLDELPLTSNRKVDRNALPAPDRVQEAPDIAYAPPESYAETTIAVIWSELLQVSPVGRNSNFFDLGGHSLLLAKAHARLRSTFPAELSMTDLFRYPTVRALAERLTTRSAAPDIKTRAEMRIAALERRSG